MIKENILVWDLETSGLDGDAKILEIGAMLFINGKVEKYQWYLNHGIEIPTNITAINGITKEMIDEKGQDPKFVLMEFIELFKRADRHVTHNGFHFDIPFLAQECFEVLQWVVWSKEFFEEWLYATGYDTAVRVKADKLNRRQDKAYPRFAKEVMEERVLGLKYNLKQTVEEYGLEYKDAHQALGDVEMTYRVYQKQQKMV